MTPITTHPFLLIALFILAQALVSPANAKENASSRETHKLEARPKEQLSAQELTDIYVFCVGTIISDPDKRAAKSLAPGDIRQHCEEERKNLSAKLSPQAIDRMDSIFVSKYNEKLAQSDIKPSKTEP